ncbi:MAG: DUF2096 domain-containing protein [Methanobrevibacter sp.]|jgi:hypothetical protein|nr:DUF2096 domain-containing protein [Candidatus Methanoflexus mossambicus]
MGEDVDLAIDQTWLVLVDLLTDLKKKGVEISPVINRDLSLIKTSVSFYKKDMTHPDMIREFDRANITITEIQDKLFDLAFDFGNDYVKTWTDKLRRANMGEKVYEKADSKSKFISNPPPGFSVARINLKSPIAEDRVQEIAEYDNLIIEFDDDNLLAIYGDKENVQRGLKELASFFNE